MASAAAVAFRRAWPKKVVDLSNSKRRTLKRVATAAVAAAATTKPPTPPLLVSCGYDLLSSE